MRMYWLCGGLLLALLAALGCGSRAEPDAAPEDTATRLGETIEVSVADWLKLPRPDLARLSDEWAVTVRKQREQARDNIESVLLLPGLHPPAEPVVFAEARYAPAAGFSLPPYVAPGARDAAVALHLARFGDREAASKLADPGDRELSAKIAAASPERNYPVEWARLVGLILEAAQYKLANGEPEGATELVVLHRQLRAVLDEKAARGPLGAALLPRGRRALAEAAVAWREPRLNKSALAQDIDAALADWGPVPNPAPALTAGAGQADVARLFGVEARGRAVIARTPAALQRTLDLLALPLPAEGVRAIVASLDGKQALTEVLLVYRPKVNELFPEPVHLAHALVEHQFKAETPAPAPGLVRQVYTGGGLSFDVAVLPRSSAGGALVRIGPAGAAPPGPSFARNPRDFGAAHLDRSFEQNRLGLAPEQNSDALEITSKEALARITQPVTEHPLAAALLQRQPAQDLLASLLLRWPADQNAGALTRLALPLWAAYGPARIEDIEDAQGGHLVLTWEDSTTRLRLRLPFDDQPPELTAQDARGPDGLKARIEAAAETDRRERGERLAAGKPRTRLSRSLALPAHNIEGIRLGMTRDEVQAALPGTRAIRVQPLSDGLNVLFLAEPPATATHWPRQLFVRFGGDGRAVEVRVRYQEGPHAPGAGMPSLLDTLKKKPNGAPESRPAPWAGLWTDLPGRKPSVLFRWRDDTTVLTDQNDKGGSEVVLRDCPADRPFGVELPPLMFCSRGPEHASLGEPRADLLRRWHNVRPLTASNGAEVLGMPTASPYDVLLVWYEGGKVSRLIARHRNPKPLQPAEVGTALQEAWSRDLDRLGYVRRQDGPHGQVLQAYGWHDDRTRVRIFAQETEEGPRLFTEWREWPVPSQTIAAKK